MSQAAIRCAENVSLLHLLHEVPMLPFKNDFDATLHQPEDYKLSFSEEKRLVDHLAFLSNVHDNVNYVPALCVREDSSSLEVLLAVNRSGEGAGEQVLEDIRRAFEDVFKVLSEVSQDHSSSRTKDDVLTAIVAMCSLRICRRLGFCKNRRNQDKQSVQTIARLAISSVKQLNGKTLGIHRALSEIFVQRTKHIIKLAEAWIKHQVSARLMPLVQEMHRLRDAGDIKALLKLIPNRTMDPSQRDNLITIIDKVSRYQDVAAFLLRMARRFMHMRNFKVTCVELPKNLLNRPPLSEDIAGLSKVLERLDTPKRKINPKKLHHILGRTSLQANKAFADQTMKTLRESKIHAEVQLIYYCDSTSSATPPRVIASSKQACFLCNAFIAVHGKMYTSRCHARIYPGWRLPYDPSIDHLAQKLNVELEQRIRTSIETLLTNGRKIAYPTPNESNLFTIIASTSTLPILSGHTGEAEEEYKELQALDDDTPSIGDASSTSAILLEVEGDDEPLTAGRFDSLAIMPHDIRGQVSLLDQARTCEDQSHETNAEGPADTELELKPGQPHFHRMAIGQQPIRYTANALELFVEGSYQEVLHQPPKVNDALTYSIEWLAAGKVSERSMLQTIDVRKLEGEATFELDDHNSIGLVDGGTIVKIGVGSRSPPLSSESDPLHQPFRVGCHDQRSQ